MPSSQQGISEQIASSQEHSVTVMPDGGTGTEAKIEGHINEGKSQEYVAQLSRTLSEAGLPPAVLMTQERQGGRADSQGVGKGNVKELSRILSLTDLPAAKSSASQPSQDIRCRSKPGLFTPDVALDDIKYRIMLSKHAIKKQCKLVHSGLVAQTKLRLLIQWRRSNESLSIKRQDSCRVIRSEADSSESAYFIEPLEAEDERRSAPDNMRVPVLSMPEGLWVPAATLKRVAEDLQDTKAEKTEVRADLGFRFRV